jgi:hypothetical protein
MRALSMVSFLPLLLLAAACGRDKESGVQVGFSGESASAVMPSLEEGDVKITSTDGAIVLAAIGDTVRMQLSDSVRATVSEKLEAKAEGKSDLGAAITRSVGKAVSGAMGFVVRVPVTEVENLRYENGEIRFDTKGGNVKMTSTRGNTTSNARFSPEDALRFIEAVQRKQAAKEVAM